MACLEYCQHSVVPAKWYPVVFSFDDCIILPEVPGWLPAPLSLGGISEWGILLVAVYFAG